MFVFGSIFGKKGFEKGSPRPPVSRRATLEKIWQKIGLPVTGVCPGHSVWRTFISAAPRARRISARPETVSPMAARPVPEHNIGGAHPRALSPRRWKTPSGMSPQSGRSMIEMLAVLAIMGILTVGGIVAYSFAVAKHRANQIYNQVDLRAVSAFTNPIVKHTATDASFRLPGFDDTFENLPYEHTKVGKAAFQIKVSNVPKNICRRLQDMTFKLPRHVTLNGEEVSSACKTQNTFVFVYDGLSVGKPSTGVPPIACECSGCQSCETGSCQDNDNLCGPKEVCVSGTCQCAPDYTECMGSCYTACGDGLMRDPISCDCVCEPQSCPDFALWDETTCSCQCQSPLTYDSINNACVCPTGYSGPFEDGSCQRLYCDYPYCYLNGDLCGYDCDDEAKACDLATCWSQECSDGTTLQHVPAGKVIFGGYEWACRIDGTDCFIRRAGREIYCFDDDEGVHPCCRADNAGNCTRGMCGNETCPAGGQKERVTVDGEHLIGCAYDNGVSCLAMAYEDGHPSTWQCFLAGLVCSTDCTNPPVCDGACAQVTCPEGTTLQGEMCCKGDVCCDYQTNECFVGNNRCGYYCYPENAFGHCSYGDCLNLCSNVATWAYDSLLDAYTCQKGTFSCFSQKSSSQRSPLCYKDGEECGSKCAYDATNCQNVYMEECAQDITYSGETKKACVYHKPVTETCFCDTALETPVGTLCCPAGHVIENGGCSIPLSS